MKETELDTLSLWDITFRTTDEQGKERFWTTTNRVDHSSLCDSWKTQDFKVKKIK